MTSADQPWKEQIIPVVEERPVVCKDEVTTGKVHVSTHVEQRMVHIDDEVRTDRVVVQRVPVNAYVDVESQPARRTAC